MEEADRERSGFEGDWDVASATLPDGSFAYSGQIAIRRVAATYQLDWQISAGRYVGVGLQLGTRLFVACGEQPAGLGAALCQFTPGAAPTLHWSTFELAGAIGAGRFTASPTSGLEGEHQLALELPNGRLYGEWALSISRQGQVYRLALRKNGVAHFDGLGLATTQGLAFGWYPDIAQLAFLDYRADAALPNELAAVWALGNYPRLGTERLLRGRASASSRS
jgi:hypothetical protein